MENNRAKITYNMRLAALKALAAKKAERNSVQNQIANENNYSFTNMTSDNATETEAPAAPISSPVRPVRNVGLNTYESPRYNIVWEEPVVPFYRQREELRRAHAINQQIAHLSPNWRPLTGRNNRPHRRPNARQTRYGPLRAWSGNKTARRLNFGKKQRKITNYLKRRNTVAPPKNSTRKLQ